MKTVSLSAIKNSCLSVCHIFVFAIVCPTQCMMLSLTNSQQNADCCLVEFHQHPTGLDVSDRITSRPCSIAVSVESRRRTLVEPPAWTVTGTVASCPTVVVAVLSAEHHPVGVPICLLCRRQRISGVSAVAGHRQTILTNLITDGERRVFSPVPPTVITLDLQSVVCIEWYNVHKFSESFLLSESRCIAMLMSCF